MAPFRRKWVRRLLVTGGVLLVLAVGGRAWVRRWAKPSPLISPTSTPEDRRREEARLSRLGLRVPDGGTLLDHPFEAPWSSRSFVAPAHWFSPPIRVLLSRGLPVHADDVLADLDVLEPAMQRAYGGWETAKDRGWDWDGWFAQWRARLRARGHDELSLDEAFAPMDDLLAFQWDNHTQIPLARMVHSASQSWVLERAPEGPCDAVRGPGGQTHPLSVRDAAQQPRARLSPDEGWTRLVPTHYLSLPDRLDDLDAVHCGGAWIPLHRAWHLSTSLLREVDPRAESGKPQVRRLSDQVVYARLPTFVPERYRDARAPDGGWPVPSGKEKALVVDLRDNGGGAEDLGWPLLAPWVERARSQGIDVGVRQVGDSCLYPAFRWNFFTNFDPGPYAGEDLKEMQESLDRLFVPPPEGCPRAVVRTTGKWSYRDHQLERHPSKMRILAVVNEGCGSDCEAMLVELASIPETVIVGTNTLGVCQFIQPGFGVLPHSRQVFRMALGTQDAYGDGRSIDGYGLDVDILLPRKADWTLEHLAQLPELLER